MRIFAAALVLGLAAGCAVPGIEAPLYRPVALDSIDARVAKEGEDPARTSKVMTLEECIRVALANNRSIRMADRRILIAEDRVGEAWGAVLPKLTVEGLYRSRSNDQGSSFGGSTFVTGERASLTGRASLLVPIYDFGGSSNQLEAENLRVDASKLSAERVRQELTFAVSQTYFRVLEARKIESLVRDSIAVLERQLKISQDFRAQGLVAKNDVLAVEVQLAERRQELIRGQNNVELAAAVLNRVMGLDVSHRTEIADVLEAVPWTGTFDSVLRLAITKRADLRVLERQIEIAQAQYRSTRAGFLPRIFAFSEYNYNSDEFLLNNDWLAGGVGIQWTLFDGLGTLKRLNRNGREIEEAVDLRNERVDDIVLELKQAYLGVRDSAARIPVARKSIEYAEENLRVIRDQYAQGLVSSADVLTEEDRLSRARSAYFRALYDYHTAYARLTHAVGETPPTK